MSTTLTLAPEHAEALAQLWREKEAEMGGQRPDRAGECRVVERAEAEAVVILPGVLDEDDESGSQPLQKVVAERFKAARDAKRAGLRRRFAAAVSVVFKPGDLVTRRTAAAVACVPIGTAGKHIERLQSDGDWPYRSGDPRGSSRKRPERRAR